jgi:hypothetical protein
LHPSTRAPNTLNNVSLSLSLVGLVAIPAGVCNRRDRNFPPITRISAAHYLPKNSPTDIFNPLYRKPLHSLPLCLYN